MDHWLIYADVNLEANKSASVVSTLWLCNTADFWIFLSNMFWKGLSWIRIVTHRLRMIKLPLKCVRNVPDCTSMNLNPNLRPPGQQPQCHKYTRWHSEKQWNDLILITRVSTTLAKIKPYAIHEWQTFQSRNLFFSFMFFSYIPPFRHLTASICSRNGTERICKPQNLRPLTDDHMGRGTVASWPVSVYVLTGLPPAGLITI